MVQGLSKLTVHFGLLEQTQETPFGFRTNTVSRLWFYVANCCLLARTKKCVRMYFLGIFLIKHALSFDQIFSIWGKAYEYSSQIWGRGRVESKTVHMLRPALPIVTVIHIYIRLNWFTYPWLNKCNCMPLMQLYLPRRLNNKRLNLFIIERTRRFISNGGASVVSFPVSNVYMWAKWHLIIYGTLIDASNFWFGTISQNRTWGWELGWRLFFLNGPIYELWSIWLEKNIKWKSL